MSIISPEKLLSRICDFRDDDAPYSCVSGGRFAADEKTREAKNRRAKISTSQISTSVGIQACPSVNATCVEEQDTCKTEQSWS